MCGIMAYAQTPLVFLLAVKNNPLQPLMGVTYQKLNYLHRASARACILASWVHTVLWVKPLWVNGSMLRFYVVMVSLYPFGIALREKSEYEVERVKWSMYGGQTAGN